MANITLDKPFLFLLAGYLNCKTPQPRIDFETDWFDLNVKQLPSRITIFEGKSLILHVFPREEIKVYGIALEILFEKRPLHFPLNYPGITIFPRWIFVLVHFTSSRIPFIFELKELCDGILWYLRGLRVENIPRNFHLFHSSFFSISFFVFLKKNFNKL